jgi:hypothetical protein
MRVTCLLFSLFWVFLIRWFPYSVVALFSGVLIRGLACLVLLSCGLLALPFLCSMVSLFNGCLVRLFACSAVSLLCGFILLWSPCSLGFLIIWLACVACLVVSLFLFYGFLALWFPCVVYCFFSFACSCVCS